MNKRDTLYLGLCIILLLGFLNIAVLVDVAARLTVNDQPCKVVTIKGFHVNAVECVR